MKFQIFASFVALASSAMAEEVTQEFLEQPGVVWVSAQLPATAMEGITVSMVPYIRFADGRVESGFLSGGVHLIPKSCEDYIDCPIRLSEGAAFRGDYTLEDNIVRSENGQSGDVYFDRPERQFEIVSGDAMAGGMAVLDRVGDTIVQSRIEGQRTYVAIPEDMRFAAIHVVYHSQTPMFEVYHCSIATLLSVLTLPEEELTERHTQLAAYFRLIDALSRMNNEVNTLDPIGVALNRTEQEEAVLIQARMESQISTLYRLMLSNIFAQTGEVSAAEAQAQNVEMMQVMLTRFLEIAPDPDALQARFDALLPDMALAAPISVELQRAAEAGLPAFESVFCEDAH